MKNIWLDGIMGVIVGDALGLPVQFLSREEVRKNPITDMRGYGTFNKPEGTWSDDGSLTIATMQSIYDKGVVDCEDIMENFADWLLEGRFTPFGESFDEGNTCVKAITHYVKNQNTETCGVVGEWANGNGALMRILPVCLYGHEKVQEGTLREEDVLELVHRVSALTHNHLRSQMACGIYYFLVKSILTRKYGAKEAVQVGLNEAKAYYQKDIKNYTEFSYYGRMLDVESFSELAEQEIKSTGYVVDSLEAAVWSFLKGTTFEEVALVAVNLGKDTDTVGAIACGLAGVYYGYEGIPKKWLEKIQQRNKIEEKCERFGNCQKEN